MKLIHCADLHLDSKMSANLDRDSANERKGEILHTFERMVGYAAANGVAAILIAGDMFDTKNISATARNAVLFQIKTNPGIRFYYLRGNHDSDLFLTEPEDLPENLLLFGSGWTSYQEGSIVISGIELDNGNSGSAYMSLALDSRKFNIVMLHGQEAEGNAKDNTEIINLKALRNKGIDYLALGHVHAYKVKELDARGVYCYSGCLEGRGFDECGDHGFVLLDIDEETGRFTSELIPFAGRKLYTVYVDVTDCQNTAEMAAQTARALEEEGCGRESLLKIILRGTVDVECEKNVDYLLSRYRQEYYFVKIYDETSLKIKIEDYMLDKSLKGEFVRVVMGDEALGEDDKKAVIRYGLQAIAGEMEKL